MPGARPGHLVFPPFPRNGKSGMGPLPVTVCVTNYNGAESLAWCLDAVLALDPAPAEILLVDNASTDRSLLLVREKYPSVRIVVLPENRGPCPARNAGLEKASHPLVFQIDNDVAPRPDCLALLLTALKEGGDRVAACHERLSREFEHKGVRVARGPFITVSTLTSSLDQASRLHAALSPVMEAMEGAASAHIAALYKVPFIEVRAASNYTGERDKGKWDLERAAKHLGEAFTII